MLLAVLLLLLPPGCTSVELLMDQCGVRVQNNALEDVVVFARSHNCYRCVPQPWPVDTAPPLFVEAGSKTDFFPADSGFGSTFFMRLANKSSVLAAQVDHQGRQHGHYTFTLSEGPAGVEVTVEIDNVGNDQFVPLYCAIAIVAIVGFASRYADVVLLPVKTKASVFMAWVITRIDGEQPESLGGIAISESREALINRARGPAIATKPEAVSGSGVHAVKASERLRALDTFRGFALSVMIFTNYGCAGYVFCVEAAWNGLTMGLIVQPFFMWIMGASMEFVFSSLIKKEARNHQVVWKVVRRFLILFAIGLFLNLDNGIYFHTWRIQGVLQRLAISYLVISCVLWFLGQVRREDVARGKFDDIVLHWKEWVFVWTCQLIWILITYLAEYPGCGRGYLGPGGIGDEGKYVNCTGGIAQYIDLKVFGENHIYGGTPGDEATCHDLYKCGAHDPEGLLGNLTCFLMTYSGVHAGRILKYWKSPKDRMIRFGGWAVFYGLLAIALTGGSKDEGWMPLNANLWTLSFVVCHISLAFIGLGLFYLLIDVFGAWSGMPFRPMGMNSIAIYFAHLTLQPYFPFTFYDTDTVKSHTPFLVMNLVGVGTLMFAAWYMDRIKFYIKI